MNPEFVFVGETATRDEVLKWMRLQDLNVDQLDTIVLLDADAKFSGTVPVARLLLAEPEDALAQLRERILGAVGPNAGLLTAMLPEFCGASTIWESTGSMQSRSVGRS